MAKNSKKLAVFDLDGTITHKDTFLEFIKYSRGTLAYYFGLLRLSPFILRFYLKGIPNHVLKEKFFGYFFKNQSYQATIIDGENFSENEIPKLSMASAIKVLDWHRSQNHDILILSASAKLWLHKWCEFREYDLICTQFEVSDNQFTGKLGGTNCYGEEKKKRLTNYLSGKEYSYIYGYGDSKADGYFLELVDESYLMPLSEKNVAEKWKANA